MPIDIIRVRRDPQLPAEENALVGGIIIEAVVATRLLPKLGAMGIDVCQVPPKHE